ncbi:HET-domain-containing protein [Lentinus tigrinus ALCF2SS1-7]|uniref:HET-domain-containing protein n=1 Tax=Lentinus tigrinus ALCF2SS1-6 TaxID=1328759 RepID=A0A5C2RS44_9APHY|nr:HET-domain-containing protein [Lentinus tigrinus ALCF2SS1-6]RPD69626.1 HET-domain-containing protein [Lentinus tigrinus ALCF2SS1-7]
MRLLNTTTGRFQVIIDPRSVRYAILSHVWSRPEDGPGYKPEQSYQDVARRIAQAGPDGDALSKLSEKIRKACEIARMHGFEFIWIDTCCIDQTSSAEVSESINSMFEWYSCSNVCYAYLDTVEPKDHARQKVSHFRRSRWFKRGWTLQELIAPQNVLFLSKAWTIIGTKYSLAHIIEEETEIDAEVLRYNRMPSQVPVAQRMGWASKRSTTKTEDAAYCLVGIFGVNLTPIYGEGAANAFIRLQKAILESSPDQSIFVWGKHVSASSLPKLSVDSAYSAAAPDPYLLASSPTNYIEGIPQIASISPERLAERLGGQTVRYPRYSLTSSGLCTRLPLIQYTHSDVDYWLAVLSCEDREGNLIALVLHPVSGPLPSSPTHSRPPETVLCVGVSATSEAHGSGVRTLSQTDFDRFRVVTLSQAQIDACLQAEGKFHPDAEVYIKHCPLGTDLSMHRTPSSHNRTRLTHDMFPHAPFDVMLSEWSDQLLRTNHQFLVEIHPSGAERSCSVELKKGNETIAVSLQRCDCAAGQNDGELCVKVRPAPPGPKSKRLQCKNEHVAQWSYRDGIACTTYGLKQLSNGEARYLRVSLSLRDWSPQQLTHSQYILDIELLTHPNNSSHSLPPLHHANADNSPIAGTAAPQLRHPERTLREQALRHGTHPLPAIAIDEASTDAESEHRDGHRGSGRLPKSSTVPAVSQKLQKKAGNSPVASRRSRQDASDGVHSAPDRSEDMRGDPRSQLERLDTSLSARLEPLRGRRGLSNDSTVYDRLRPRSDSPAPLDNDSQAFDPNDPFIQTMTGQTLTPVSAQSTQRHRIHGPASFTDGSSSNTHGQALPDSARLGRRRSASDPNGKKSGHNPAKEKRRSKGLLRLPWKKRNSTSQ